MLWAPYARAVGEAVGEAVMPRQDTGTPWTLALPTFGPAPPLPGAARSQATSSGPVR